MKTFIFIRGVSDWMKKSVPGNVDLVSDMAIYKKR